MEEAESFSELKSQQDPETNGRSVDKAAAGVHSSDKYAKPKYVLSHRQSLEIKKADTGRKIGFKLR